MKKTENKHWYDSIIRPINGKRKDERDNISVKSHPHCSPTIALPMIEEWATPEDFAA